MTQWNITITTRDPYTETSALSIMDALSRFHVATGRAISGRTEATFTLDAETLGQATTLALALTEPLGAATIQVMTASEWDARVVDVPDLLSVTEAASRAGVTRQAILQRIEAGTLSAKRVGNAWAIPACAI